MMVHPGNLEQKRTGTLHDWLMRRVPDIVKSHRVAKTLGTVHTVVFSIVIIVLVMVMESHTMSAAAESYCLLRFLQSKRLPYVIFLTFVNLDDNKSCIHLNVKTKKEGLRFKFLSINNSCLVCRWHPFKSSEGYKHIYSHVTLPLFTQGFYFTN